MSSMTDIVFLLLIFFLVTSTLINPNALRLLLPKSTNQISAKATVSVSIKHYPEEGTFSYHINGDSKAIPFSDIEPALQLLLKDSEDPTFSIYADRTVPIEEVVNLILYICSDKGAFITGCNYMIDGGRSCAAARF